jgi:RNA polymerase sigma-70 factor, ECF subfamily
VDAQFAPLPSSLEPLAPAPAFAQLVRAHQARVFSIALRLIGNREEAEEVAQDVFLQLHAVLAELNGEAHVRHWLLRTVSHRAIDRLRARERRPRLVVLDGAHEPAALESDEDPLAQRRLRALLAQLQPDARAVVLLRFQEDLDPSDIAQMLNMSVNTVKSHLRRSLEWLRVQTAGEEHGY